MQELIISAFGAAGVCVCVRVCVCGCGCGCGCVRGRSQTLQVVLLNISCPNLPYVCPVPHIANACEDKLQPYFQRVVQILKVSV